MEDFVYIILVIVWLLVSFLRRKPKKDQPAKKPVPAEKQGSEPAAEGEVSMEEMLEEFFGGGKKKKKNQPVPKEEPVYEAADRTRRTETYERDERWGSDKRDRRRPEPAAYGKEEVVQDEAIREFEGQSGVSDDFEFSTEGKIQTIDELIESHKKEEALRLALEEDVSLEGPHGAFPDFDLRTAVVFSEILNRKYH